MKFFHLPGDDGNRKASMLKAKENCGPAKWWRYHRKCSFLPIAVSQWAKQKKPSVSSVALWLCGENNYVNFMLPIL
jgi:hypothetical protein